eukprot:CAMPEP_0172314328 /NCGR_PEP_ID=MMETSP1058-20130122/22246_1 /TAXON_ID=83371 /ORGANISM="Detonula confervacea, Strain CCMP 353" /LENGTH=357 /DNA_ID=CAMNT_0013028159 /DNA_START=55 /DNA_END=1128 /DNA_ORIENTATION=+
MSLESTNNQAFLGNDAADDDFAALDAMAFTGTQSQSQFGMNTVAMTSNGSFGSSSDHSGGRGVGVGDGRDNGFSGVSGSLFDRIRARTAEQQKQTLPSQSSQVSQSSTQEAAQSSQQSAFMSQQPSSEPTMELERSNSNKFDAAVDGASIGASANQNSNSNNNETTYSFSATAGEDFSQAAAATPSVPVYGASRDDPYYIASNNHQQQQPTTIQDKATMALAQTGETVKSLWDAGVSGAQTIGTMAQEKMGGGGDGAGGGQRSYNNNFLLREDSLEHGDMMGSATMSQPPPPAAAAPGSDTAGGASDQAYSMLNYGKTFFQDVFGFVMQLPPWGRGLVAVILLWAIYVIFGFFDREL